MKNKKFKIIKNDGNHYLRSRLARLKFSPVRSPQHLQRTEGSQKPVPRRRAIVMPPPWQPRPAMSGTRPGMPTKSGGDVPNHIRENLPEELSDLPADLIYATNIRVHEFSYSAAALRSVEARESLKEELRVRCGGTWSRWPGWTVHAAMRLMMNTCASAGCRKMP